MTNPARPEVKDIGGFLALVELLYGWVILAADTLKHGFLLLVRLYWGWQFFISGRGKLGNLDNVTKFFQSLGIPFPKLNAIMAGGTECVGGLLLLLGLCSRVTAVPLIITMLVAYATDGSDALKVIFHDQDKFLKYDAFPFLMAALIVFFFGPGLLSLDGLIGHFLKNRKAAGAKTGE